MRIQRTGWALLLGVAGLGMIAAAQNATAPPAQQGASPNLIGTHQIDRIEAIRLLQEATKSNPKDVADWIILGELAHEVALDLSSDQDDAYYKLSREAYEKALALQPNNAGLKAAVQFAKDQEAGAARFDEARKRAAKTYIETRKRELAATNMIPTVQVYAAPAAAPPANSGAIAKPAAGPVEGQPVPPSRTLPTPYYGYPVYQPYAPVQGEPYTYNQFARTYSYQVPNSNAMTQPPMTLRQYTRQLPGIIANDAARAITRPPR